MSFSPVLDSISDTAFSPPAVTSSAGPSTVVGASPTPTMSYLSPSFLNRTAFVVLAFTSTARIDRFTSRVPISYHLRVTVRFYSNSLLCETWVHGLITTSFQYENYVLILKQAFYL